jgi:hypothetical protein
MLQNESASLFADFQRLLASEQNLSVKHVMLGGGSLEITIYHQWSQNSTIRAERTLTLWQAIDNQLVASSLGINEDMTVSTPNIELFALTLPFEASKLVMIQIDKDDGDWPVSYRSKLTFHSLAGDEANAEIAHRETLSIDLLAGEAIYIKPDSSS